MFLLSQQSWDEGELEDHISACFYLCCSLIWLEEKKRASGVAGNSSSGKHSTARKSWREEAERETVTDEAEEWRTRRGEQIKGESEILGMGQNTEREIIYNNRKSINIKTNGEKKILV